MIRPAPCSEASFREHGVTLLTGLVLLAAISLLALVAASSMALQLRMAGNFEDSRLAAQNSAVAVTLGEDFLYSIRSDSRLAACHTACFNPPLSTIIHPAAGLPPFPEYENESWWRLSAVDASIDPLTGLPMENAGAGGADHPRYLIEEVYFDPLTGVPVAADAPVLNGIGYYRILGRGSGRNSAAIAVSESIIARPWTVEAMPGSSFGNSSEFCTGFKPWYNCGRMAWRQR